MIDWLTIMIWFKHKPLNGGRIVSTDPDGSVEWELTKKVSVRGSFESNTIVRSCGDIDKDGYISCLQLDGNPSKYLQGHNIYGSDDPNLLAAMWVRQVCVDLGLFMMPSEVYRVSRGGYEVNRVDINYMFDVVQNVNVDQFLIALADSGGTKYRKAMFQKGSVYFNMGSRRWSVVFYNKLDETGSKKKGHRILLGDELKEKLRNAASGKVRAEARIMSLELKDREIRTGCELVNYGVSKLYGEIMSRIQVNGNMRIADEKAATMPNAIRGTYEHWLSGCDCRSLMSRMTFYRHKKALKEGYGIDIDSGERKVTSNVVALSRVLELVPAATPQFLYDEDLIVWRRQA